MDDRALTRLLHLVDEPGPEPREFRVQLRAELQETLEHESGSSGGRPRPAELRPAHEATSGPRRFLRPLTVAASIAAAVVGVLVVAGGDRDPVPPAASSPPTPAPSEDVATTLPPTSPAEVVTVGAACAAYSEVAAPRAELEAFASVDGQGGTSPPGSPGAAVPDIASTATALDELRTALVDGDLVDEATARSLRIASGGMSQAAVELEAGDTDAAAASVGFALRALDALSDPPDPVVLTGCDFG